MRYFALTLSWMIAFPANLWAAFPSEQDSCQGSANETEFESASVVLPMELTSNSPASTLSLFLSESGVKLRFGGLHLKISSTELNPVANHQNLQTYRDGFLLHFEVPKEHREAVRERMTSEFSGNCIEGVCNIIGSTGFELPQNQTLDNEYLRALIKSAAEKSLRSTDGNAPVRAQVIAISDKNNPLQSGDPSTTRRLQMQLLDRVIAAKFWTETINIRSDLIAALEAKPNPTAADRLELGLLRRLDELKERLSEESDGAPTRSQIQSQISEVEKSLREGVDVGRLLNIRPDLIKMIDQSSEGRPFFNEWKSQELDRLERKIWELNNTRLGETRGDSKAFRIKVLEYRYEELSKNDKVVSDPIARSIHSERLAEATARARELRSIDIDNITLAGIIFLAPIAFLVGVAGVSYIVALFVSG